MTDIAPIPHTPGTIPHADNTIPGYTQVELDNIFKSAQVTIKTVFTTVEKPLTAQEIADNVKPQPGKRTCRCHVHHAKTGESLHVTEASNSADAVQKAAAWVVSQRGGKVRDLTRDQEIDKANAELRNQLEKTNELIKTMQDRIDTLTAANGAPPAAPVAEEAPADLGTDHGDTDPHGLKALSWADLKVKATEVGITGVNMQTVGREKLTSLIASKLDKPAQ